MVNKSSHDHLASLGDIATTIPAAAFRRQRRKTRAAKAKVTPGAHDALNVSALAGNGYQRRALAAMIADGRIALATGSEFHHL
jgi:hypothetical protein